jgi:hypothetical protein
METTQTPQGESCQSGCRHGMCGSCGAHGCKHCLLYWLFGLLVLVIVFCLGFKLGELKSNYEGGRSGGYTRYGGYGGTLPMMQLPGGGQNRMFYISGGVPPTTASPTQPAQQTVPTKK